MKFQIKIHSCGHRKDGTPSDLGQCGYLTAFSYHNIVGCFSYDRRDLPCIDQREASTVSLPLVPMEYEQGWIMTENIILNSQKFYRLYEIETRQPGHHKHLKWKSWKEPERGSVVSIGCNPNEEVLLAVLKLGFSW